MHNKFLGTGDKGYHPVRKIRVIISGIKYAVKYDWSVTYKLVLSIIILLVFFFFRQWVDFFLLAAATVIMLQAELFNSAIEATCDFITTKENEKVKVIKDISAAAAGLCIFLWALILVVESWRVFKLIVG